MQVCHFLTRESLSDAMELHVVLFARHQLVHVLLAESNLVGCSLEALKETHVERLARVLLLLLLLSLASRLLLLVVVCHLLLGLLLLLGWSFAAVT